MDRPGPFRFAPSPTVVQSNAMGKEVGRVQRLIALISEVKTNPTQKPDQLCRSLKISRSQFFQDRRALAELGFEFDFSRKQNRYVVKADPYLPVLDLSAGEAFSLVMAVRQLSATGDHVLTYEAISAIRKIVANSERRIRSLLLAALDDVVLHGRFQVRPEVVDSLRRAHQRCERLEIQYDDFSQQRVRKIEIDPYMIFFKGRALYADAYLPAEQQVLMLRVSRVKKVLRRVGNFAVRGDYDFAARHRHSFRVMTGDGNPQEVRIRFDAKTARYIREAHWHESQQMIDCDDGGLILVLRVSEPREVLWYLVFPWGDSAEILEPEWLRTEAARVARRVVRIYDKTMR